MRHLIIILVAFFVSYNALAQIRGFYDGNHYYEKERKTYFAPPKKSTHFSIFLGPSNYLGDLGGNTGVGKAFLSDNNFKKRTFFYGVALTHYQYEAIGIRLNYSAGKIAGSDEDVTYKNKNDNAYYRFKRNLNFQSKISEGSLLFEIFPFKFINYNRTIHQFSFQPYTVFGIGIYKFNPQGSYFDDIQDDYVWVDLKPLHTEGQGMTEYTNRKEYKSTQANIPFGMGIRYNISDKTSLSFEFIGRKLFTDYLDDVSTNFISPALFSKYLNEDDAAIAKVINNKSNIIDPDNPYLPGEKRGDPNHKDFYYSFNLKFSIRISKMKEIANFFKGTIYKYDDSEICE